MRECTNVCTHTRTRIYTRPATAAVGINIMHCSRGKGCYYDVQILPTKHSSGDEPSYIPLMFADFNSCNELTAPSSSGQILPLLQSDGFTWQRAVIIIKLTSTIMSVLAIPLYIWLLGITRPYNSASWHSIYDIAHTTNLDSMKQFGFNSRN